MPDTKNSARPKKLLRQLGKISDHELAAEFNLSTYRVRAERIKRSILAFKYGSWTPENTALLGTMTDKQAASLAGVTTNAAFTKRVSMGIPPFGKSSEDAKFQWTEAHQRSLGSLRALCLQNGNPWESWPRAPSRTFVSHGKNRNWRCSERSRTPSWLKRPVVVADMFAQNGSRLGFHPSSSTRRFDGR